MDDIEELESLDYRPETNSPELDKLKAVAEQLGKDIITITALHAYSLTALVEHWKKMINCLGQSNCELTQEYCDELLEDLKG